ncbi:Hypothetical protein NCS54_01196300 [Fusarium falciforme]|uniref:Hypothetical protein n=1 Tax=Fusarium falciforme TaxID=195108 RepID=UPI00230031DC|nr:Hypothetical protein NCS54_01196300 [Fusarium falciforme]WAO94382.1 Hypothetical protein NCS54_01196300 [Fusarium falciforme]
MQHYSQDLPKYPQHPRRPTRRADMEAYFEYVYLQAWASGSSRVYWIVARNGQLTRPTVPVGHMSGSALSRRDRIGQEQQDLIRSVQEREHQRNHGLAADMQTSAAGSATMYAEQRPWLERTRWEITYRNRDRSLHRCLIQTPYLSFYGRPDAPPYLLASAARVTGLSTDLVSPREDEIKIDGILKAVDVVMDRCEETVHRTSRNLLCWLKSNHPHMPYSKPFTLVKHASSTTRYRLLLKKALAFCFRVYRMDAKQRERLIGVHFNKKLNRFLDEIWHHEDLANLPLVTEDVAQVEGRAEEANGDEMGVELEDMDMDMDGNVYGDLDKEDDDDDDGYSDLQTTTDNDSDDDADIPSDDDENGEGGFTNRPERVESLGSLDELVFGLSLALCTERLKDGQPSSTVLVYFSGILAFSEATNSFHNARSYTPYLSGLIYIQRLLFLERALPLRPYALLRIERRPRFKQLERFKQVHRRHMVMGSQSTFEEFVSLRAYGCVAARNDTPSFFLYWSDDGQRVSWGQATEVSMGQFRSLSAYLIREANRLCNDLMFGLEPDIDLLKIKDNMANCDKGYSFVTDPRNELTSAYLDLLRRACTARSGCLSRGNSWNWAEVDQYMKKDEDFRELLGTGMSLTGGQLPRWPELSSLWVENDELGPRGLYVYKGYIIYVVRHHKAKSSTNREFVVVRFLPAELALAVFKYCTYIRPFINLLDRERGIVSPSEAGQSSSPLLFRTQTVSSNSKVWSTSRFTSVIRKVTTEAWGLQ